MNGWSTGFIDKHPAIGQQLIFVADLMLIGILFNTVFAGIAAVAGLAYSVFLVVRMLSGWGEQSQLRESGISSLVLAVIAVVATWRMMTWEAAILLVGWAVVGGVALMQAQRKNSRD